MNIQQIGLDYKTSNSCAGFTRREFFVQGSYAMKAFKGRASVGSGKALHEFNLSERLCANLASPQLHYYGLGLVEMPVLVFSKYGHTLRKDDRKVRTRQKLTTWSRSVSSYPN